MDKFPTDKMCAIVPINDPSPVGYINVFEQGDVWWKTKGCKGCPVESQKMCCNHCKIFSPVGCGFQADDYISATNKPYQCVVKPTPEQGRSYCQLQFTCIKGKHKGKVRNLNKSLDEIGV